MGLLKYYVTIKVKGICILIDVSKWLGFFGGGTLVFPVYDFSRFYIVIFSLVFWKKKTCFMYNLQNLGTPF